ncbi:MAG: Hsp33 family molecular chaperone HslO [Clostridiales bacterium]|nr:Hsp33 family molecular chaperone HslO [Clostridiales bacterium]
MIRDDLIFNEPDSLLRMTISGMQARVLMCRTTRLTQQAADIHQASDVATTAMGRLLSASAMLFSSIEDEGKSITATVSGDGVGGSMTVVGHSDGKLKIAVENPQAELPLRSDGKQDVGGFVGRHGKLTIIRDRPDAEPYIGISNLVSGELGLDFAEYFTMSEQTPSLVALGCLNQKGTVLSAGGILIQALPGCEISVIEELEKREPFFAGISRELYDKSMRELAEFWFQGMDLELLSAENLVLQCDCSREKMRRALLSLGREELLEMGSADDDTEMACHFCRSNHKFSARELNDMAKHAAVRGE